VSRELLDVATLVDQRVAEIAKPQIALRLGVWSVVVLLLLALVVVPFAASVPRSFALPELVQVTEAGINILVVVGGAVFFLVSTERRVKRGRVLTAIQELRALAHVMDMHQLSKDPQRVLEPRFVTTASSPEEPMGRFELARYLDYCTEMFSLTGKLAALYATGQDDPAVVAAVNEVEDLTTGLSRKVWQKIMILQLGLAPG